MTDTGRLKKGFNNRQTTVRDMAAILIAIPLRDSIQKNDTEGFNKFLAQLGPDTKSGLEKEYGIDLLNDMHVNNTHLDREMLLLALAAYTGRAEFVQSLIDAGADPNAKDEQDQTSLHWAASSGQTDIVQILISAGAKVDAEDVSKNTPLHFAAMTGQADTVQTLIDNGADPKAENKLDVTPLHWAELYGQMDIAQTLINNGADPNAKDNNGKTPSDYGKISLESESTVKHVATDLGELTQ